MQSTHNTVSATANASLLPLVGRLLIATIFLVSGYGKLMAPSGTIGYIASVGLPLPQFAYAGALIAELGGGLLLVLGYRTRLVAAALAVFSVVSALLFHNALGDQNQLFHFLKNLAMAGGLLQFITYGAGSINLDSRKATVTGVLGTVR